ncbi:MAG: protein kinase [Myxococcales bacterium]|nr:protein kinase [Myxococcales bacterium]
MTTRLDYQIDVRPQSTPDLEATPAGSTVATLDGGAYAPCVSEPDRDLKTLAGAATLPVFPAEPTPPPAPRPGVAELAAESVLAGRYQVETLIGRGGMGAVYVAKDRLLGVRIALKVLELGLGDHGDAVEALRAEVRLARKVTHPNVVRIHDLVETDGTVFLTMELCEGTDLRRVLLQEGGWLSAERAARVAQALAGALDAAHAVGVVHRDIKPENILVDPSGRVLLSDFGIALANDPAAASPTGKKVLGTPAYMAPEQVERATVGPAADVFSLGVVLFEMLAGELPYDGESAVQMAVARLESPPKDLRADRSIPEALAQLARRCLTREASERPSAAEVAADLERFLEGRASVSSAVPTPTGGYTFPDAPRGRALACPPFVYRGPAEHEYLGEALASELVDVLSRTRNLRVLSSGATAKLETRDPRTICAALGIDYVVDGSVHVADGQMRIAVRLADATGTQLFADRFDLGWVDVFDVQERAGKLVSEALRLELTARSTPSNVPEEAILLYLRARRAQKSFVFAETPRVVQLLERALTLAPTFVPAAAAYANAAVQMWFLPQGATTIRDWRAVAEQSVGYALRYAPDLAETHVAAARFASHSGDLLSAIRSFRRALEIAPTSAEAHTLIGQLECETGRLESGLARLRMAKELEPASGAYSYEAGRAASFAGDDAGFRRRYLETKQTNAGLVAAHMALRHALWWRDDALLQEAVETSSGSSIAALFKAVARSARGEAPAKSALDVLSLAMGYVNPRFAGLLRQIGVEVLLRQSLLPEAVFALQEAHRTVLYDVAWLERCPLLVPIRGTRIFQSILAEVRFRAEEVWAK